jgi:hypothetical protein
MDFYILRLFYLPSSSFSLDPLVTVFPTAFLLSEISVLVLWMLFTCILLLIEINNNYRTLYLEDKILIIKYYLKIQL